MKNPPRVNVTRDDALTDVGVGWSSLVHKIYYKKNTLAERVYIDQVKEKFGGLRVYSSPYHEEFDEFVIDVCKKSFTLCEECGETGRLHKTHTRWYKTLCDTHGADAILITDTLF
jgi:hypothetical protein